MSVLAFGLSPRTWPIPFVPELWATMTESLVSEVISSAVLIFLLLVLRRGAHRARLRRLRERRLSQREAPSVEAEGGSPDDVLSDYAQGSSPKTYQCEVCSAVVGAYDRTCPRCGASFA